VVLALDHETAQAAENIDFVHGSGKRKSAEQKDWEKLDELRCRWAEYEEKLDVMGKERNSDSKTDTDATIMRMKEDHMRNGQMSFIKPANYEYQKSAKYKKQLGRMENMTYDADEDCYICANGRRLPLRRECTELALLCPDAAFWAVVFHIRLLSA